MDDWVVELARNRTDAAWDALLGRYRRLIFASIRHYAGDHDDVMDIFVHVCDALRADDMRRVRSYTERPEHGARFSTWLVTVVRHLAVDWFRHRDGRSGLSRIADALPPLERRIFQLVFLERRSHVEAYELLRSEPDRSALTFRAFLSGLRSTYSMASRWRGGYLLRELARPSFIDAPDDGGLDAEEFAERLRRTAEVMDTLESTERAVVQLYVIDELPAADVARMLALSGPKAVYNLAYRTLALLRERLQAAGIRRDDL